jgi:hypothetical protein
MQTSIENNIIKIHRSIAQLYQILTLYFRCVCMFSRNKSYRYSWGLLWIPSLPFSILSLFKWQGYHELVHTKISYFCNYIQPMLFIKVLKTFKGGITQCGSFSILLAWFICTLCLSLPSDDAQSSKSLIL